MKHIKTPVTMAKLTSSIWEGDALLCHVGSGDADSYRKANEITLVLNERDDVIAQRDAMVNACDMMVEADDFDDAQLARLAVKAARDALALVRREGK